MLLQYGYRMSKTAVNMAGKLLAEDLAAQAIPVGIVHPGPVREQLFSLKVAYCCTASPVLPTVLHHDADKQENTCTHC
jgi:NAD(P)-dependent dehydrogenase (short-subunit alcohol dehydrogenase family)